jgi:hypothetical protein
VKRFRFNFGFAEICVRVGWLAGKEEISIQKYEIASRDLLPEIERCLLRRVKRSMRTGSREHFHER